MYTLNEIASDLGLHPITLTQWKKHDLEAPPEIISGGHAKSASFDEAQLSALYEEIGRPKVELDWLKKGPARSVSV